MNDKWSDFLEPWPLHIRFLIFLIAPMFGVAIAPALKVGWLIGLCFGILLAVVLTVRVRRVLELIAKIWK